MQSVYSDHDYLAIYKQRKNILTVFFAITGAYLAFCLGWLVYHFTLPYADPLDNIPRTCVYVASAVYILVIFPFWTIKYSRANRYYKLFKHFCVALKMEETYHFYAFRECTLQKDNVDAIGCVFAVWDKKKQRWLERVVYWDPEKELPNFEQGDLVRYITQSTFILQYEIIQKQAADLSDAFAYERYIEWLATAPQDEEQDEQETEEQAIDGESENYQQENDK